MNVVFNPVPAEYEDDSEYFKDAKGRSYYYEVEISEEGGGEGHFKITDTCNRYVPFDFESLDDLVLVLTNMQKSLKMQKRLLASRDAFEKELEEFESTMNNIWANK